MEGIRGDESLRSCRRNEITIELLLFLHLGLGGTELPLSLSQMLLKPCFNSASIDRYGASKSSEKNESNPRRFQFLSDEPVPPVLDGTLLEFEERREVVQEGLRAKRLELSRGDAERAEGVVTRDGGSSIERRTRLVRSSTI